VFRSALVVVALASSTSADERKPDATLGETFRGPFPSSRLFAMPVADTVGAYMFTLSGDGSLLQQPGVLTSAGVLAIGFGDIAQLEYRHTGAISVTGVDAPVPAVGVQLKLPIPERPNVPALGVAFRFGVDRDEDVGGMAVTEKVTDIYAVLRERLEAAPWLTVHGGVRYSPSSIVAAGVTTTTNLWLPAAGFELEMNREARIVGEGMLVPQFHWMLGDTKPSIGRGALARFGMRWRVLPWATFDASFGYQLDSAMGSGTGPRDIVQQWDIRLGAEVFVPWGALACRALGAFCD
jgi:hypothetical protein